MPRYRLQVQKSSSIVLGAAFLMALVGLLLLGSGHHGSSTQVSSALMSSQSASVVSPSSGAPLDAPLPSDTPFSLPSMELPMPLLPRALASSAPSRVRLGIVLVTYCQAEYPPTPCRSKEEAFLLARHLHEIALRSFPEAVQKGDPGSTENAGDFSQGVLESSFEPTVFSLSVGEVSPPLDTPRGFWIAKRLK